MTWKVIPGHSRYQVSDKGEVQNIETGKVLKHQSVGHKLRYRKVALTLGVQRYVHRLVIEAFVGPIPSHLEVCHIDGDPSNNNLDNLKLGTSTENSADCIDHGNTNRGERMWKSKINERIVRIIRGLDKLGYPRIRIAEICSVTTKHVSAVIRRQSWAWVD